MYERRFYGSARPDQNAELLGGLLFLAAGAASSIFSSVVLPTVPMTDKAAKAAIAEMSPLETWENLSAPRTDQSGTDDRYLR